VHILVCLSFDILVNALEIERLFTQSILKRFVLRLYVPAGLRSGGIVSCQIHVFVPDLTAYRIPHTAYRICDSQPRMHL